MARRLRSKVFRHEAPVDDGLPPAVLARKHMLAVERHVAKHVGKSRSVWHEIVSDHVHLDILPCEPTKKRPFKTFVTMGMSASPMNVPAGFDGPDRVELCLVLPPSWPTDEKSLGARGERHWWPFRGLKDVGRLPSTFDTFLGVGHTVPNGDPPEPFAKSCPFVCWLVVPAVSVSIPTLRAGRFRVEFLQLLPLTRAEMKVKLEEGYDALVDRFAAAGLDLVHACDPGRPDTCAKTPRRAPRSKRK